MHGDRLTIEPSRRRPGDGCRTLNVRERNENDSADLCLESGGQQIGKPRGVGLRKEPLGAWSKKPPRKVDDHVGACDGRRQRRWITEIRLDRTNVGDMRHVFGQWRTMVHQP